MELDDYKRRAETLDRRPVKRSLLSKRMALGDTGIYEVVVKLGNKGNCLCIL